MQGLKPHNPTNRKLRLLWFSFIFKPQHKISSVIAYKCWMYTHLVLSHRTSILPFLCVSISVNKTLFSQLPLISLKVKSENTTQKLRLGDSATGKWCLEGQEWYSGVWLIPVHCAPSPAECRAHSSQHDTGAGPVSAPKGLACSIRRNVWLCKNCQVPVWSISFFEASPSRYVKRKIT